MNKHRRNSGQDIVYKDYSSSDVGVVLYDTSADPLAAVNDLRPIWVVRPEGVVIETPDESPTGDDGDLLAPSTDGEDLT